MASEVKPTIHDRLFVFDLDRCLIVPQLYDIFDMAVAASGVVDPQLLTEARHKREASGGSFDAIGWLQSEQGFSEQQSQQLLEQSISRALDSRADAFLSPGARILLNALKEQAIPHVIMTYGGEAYQTAKLKAASLDDIPAVVVSHKRKGHYIRGWWSDEAGCFTVEIEGKRIYANCAVLVDDKAGAFDGLPAQPYARGYWLKSVQPLLSQRGDIPPHVTPITVLDEILDYENLRHDRQTQ